MSLPFPDQSQPRRSKTILSPDGTTAKFLYTILKQLDLKTIDWNEVASQLDISNGHAARMRYSRFKIQIENLISEDHPKSKLERKDAIGKQKEKRKQRHEDLHTDRNRSSGQLKRDLDSGAKKAKVDTGDLYDFQMPIGGLKPEQTHHMPSTTDSSIKTDKGIQQSRIHPSKINAVTQKEREGKHHVSGRDYDHGIPGQVHQMQQGFRGQHNTMHSYQPNPFSSYPGPPVRAHTRYSNLPNGSGYHHVPLMTQSQQMYGNFDPTTDYWYHGPVAQQPQLLSAHPQPNNISYWTMDTSSQMPWQYNTTEMLNSAQTANTGLLTNYNSVNEGNLISTSDLAQFAAEFGDLNGVVGIDETTNLTVAEGGYTEFPPVMPLTVNAQGQNQDAGTVNTPTNAPTLENSVAQLNQAKDGPAIANKRVQSHDSLGSQNPGVFSLQQSSDAIALVSSGDNDSNSNSSISNSSNVVQTDAIKSEVMESAVEDECAIDIEIL